MTSSDSKRMTNQVNEVPDGKISAVEYWRLINLIDGIYVNAVADEINRLCEKYCFGCDMGHCNPIYHDCIIMGDRQKRFNYEGVAVRNVKRERKIWEEFTEALRLLGLRCHKHAQDRFKELEETPSMLL